MTRAERRNHWRTILDNQAASGMSVAAYCREQQITSSSYYTWRRKIRVENTGVGGFSPC